MFSRPVAGTLTNKTMNRVPTKDRRDNQVTKPIFNNLKIGMGIELYLVQPRRILHNMKTRKRKRFLSRKRRKINLDDFI